jgi:hypothetical protein
MHVSRHVSREFSFSEPSNSSLLVQYVSIRIFQFSNSMQFRQWDLRTRLCASFTGGAGGTGHALLERLATDVRHST